MSFVKLENLNDFIQPSSSCVKPIEKKSPGVVAKVNDINLSDCLACSGCITSAETVLVQQQNHGELFKIINNNKVSKSIKEIVVSLSLQSVASLANKYSMTAQETAERLASFFISIGCNRIFDINLARHLALVESYREFKKYQTENPTNAFPIISSACPGWICYAEKTNGDLLIPHLSKVRSPQQIMGALIKKSYLTNHGKNSSDVYHVTLMPCFDKKLEASRKDFKNQIDGSSDVDCVLTPLELEEILNDEGVDLVDFDRRKLDILVETGQSFDQPLTSHCGSTSGGYAENILLAEASERSGKQQVELADLLEYSNVKNTDFIEVRLKEVVGDTNQRDPSRIAIVNGFRNIQTVVQRLKRKALKYDYIEVMACPSGCINGGAQCKPNFGQDQASLIKSTSQIYRDVPQVSLDVNSPTENEFIKLKLGANDDLLYTHFQPVPKMQNLTVSW